MHMLFSLLRLHRVQTQSRPKKIQKIQKDENMVFQKNMQKMQTYLNAF